MIKTFYADRLAQRQEADLYRRRRVLQSSPGVKVVYDNKVYLSFCSNNYLGLAAHPKVVEAYKLAADKYGLGSGSACLLGGYSQAHYALEQELAEFVGYPRVLLFSTAYMANLGVLTALFNENDAIVADKRNHASLIDAAKLSGATFKRYLSNDPLHLEKQLARTRGRHNLIVSDGVFSMDGDIAPLPALMKMAEKFETLLMIDDAHGLGILGEEGAGITQHFQLRPDILVGAFGKSFGTFGAFVAASDTIIENLIQFSRPYIYTTALPPSLVEATRVSLTLIKTESWRRGHLLSLIDRFRTGAQQLDLPILLSDTPIQSVIVRDAQKAMLLCEKLSELGILTNAIRPPTVPPHQARLRISLSASHSCEHIDILLEGLKNSLLCI